MRQINKSTQTTILSALILAIASLGDALIYPVLSSDFQSLKVSLWWVGILLSINRFIRLIANRLVAYGIIRLGLRNSSILAATLAATTTLMYTLAGMIFYLLLARIAWGFAYATLRINAINVATEGKKQGFLLGLSSAIYEIGPLLALSLGPWLIQWTDVQTIFLWFGIASFAGVYVAFLLPKKTSQLPKAQLARLNLPNTIEQLVFIMALLVEGGLVVMLASLLLEAQISKSELIRLTAFYLIVRRVSGLILSPLIGGLADRLGLQNIFLATLFIVLLGFSLLAIGWIVAGIVITFMSTRIIAGLSPAIAVAKLKGTLKINVLASLTTWRDLGAALGALGGISLLNTLGREELFGLATLIMLFYLYLFYSRK